MQLQCPHCQHPVYYSGTRPRFCSQCGQSLSTASQGADDTPTVSVAPPSSGSTLLRDTTSTEPAPRVHLEGDELGSYRLVRRIGAGAMGCVFEAEHRSTSRRVAIKLIAPDISMSSAAVERFKLEGRLASMIAHPSCVFVMEADEVEGQPYIVMELMSGTTLTSLVARHGPLKPIEAIEKIIDVIDGLREAHRIGVIHRDVKPSNCFVDEKGRVKIGDFGLAKSVQEDGELTHTGAFVGTVMYSSPEQIKRQPLDVQTDVYSVCATLYFLLTGRPPFAGGDVLAAATRIVTEDPPSMRLIRPEIPVELDRIVLRGLERDKSKRWPDLDSLRAALTRFLPSTVSVGGLGYRLLAIVADLLLVGLLSSLLIPLFVAHSMSIERDFPTTVRVLALEWIIWLAYFVLPEGIKGWSLGKLLVGLRVQQAEGFEPPGLARAIARTTVFWFLLSLGELLGPLLRWFLPNDDPQDFVAALGHLATVFFGMGMYVFSVMLLCSTMRSRNGYRGLHELASGTRVVHVPWRRRLSGLNVGSYTPPTKLTPDGPRQVGRFHVVGALRQSADFRVLLADDPVLHRKVWITVHLGAARPDEVRQQDITRLSRLRWVGGGSDEGWHWDAWLAPSGMPLRELVRQRRLDWHDAAPILENLAHELVVSVEENLLPESLHVDQVWVSGEGKVQLVSFLWSDEDDTERAGASPNRNVSDSRDDRALDLLRRVAVLLLEGQPREGGEARIRAPLPRSAAMALARLFPGPDRWATPRVFRDELRRLAGQPDELSRGRRFGQITLLLLAALPFSFCVLAFPLFHDLFTDLSAVRQFEAEVQRLERVATIDLAIGMTNLDPRMRLAAAVRWRDDQDTIDVLRGQLIHAEELRDIRLRTMFPALRRGIDIRETNEFAIGDSSDAKKFIRLGRHIVRPENTADLRILALVCIAGLWCLSTAIFRGGWSFRLTGVDVVRKDGKRISFVGGIARGLLFWAPILALWCLSDLLAYWYWRDWLDVEHRRSALWLLWASTYVWRAGAALLLVYLVMALWHPQRAPHDRILGTYLVPR